MILLQFESVNQKNSYGTLTSMQNMNFSKELRCPNCKLKLSKKKDSLVCKKCKAVVLLPTDPYINNQKILDIGCGSYQVRYNPDLAKSRVGLDPSVKALIHARRLYT